MNFGCVSMLRAGDHQPQGGIRVFKKKNVLPRLTPNEDFFAEKSVYQTNFRSNVRDPFFGMRTLTRTASNL
jgi:hypothetical protein